MARSLQVVLKAPVDNLGLSGDVVRVKPGYARNYLIPRGLAVVASRENVKQIEHEKAMALARLEQRREEARELAKKFDGLVLHVAKQVQDPETGRLFGALSVSDVLEALSFKGFGDVDKKDIILPEESIKTTGSYEIAIRIAAGVNAPVRLEVKTAS